MISVTKNDVSDENDISDKKLYQGQKMILVTKNYMSDKK
jgi:hypothetical protein